MKKTITNLFLVFSPLLLVFGVGEVVCRITEPPPMQVFEQPPVADAEKKNFTVKGVHDTLYQYSTHGSVRLTPNAHIKVTHHYLSGRDIDISTNSMGFRSSELNPIKGEEFRVLVLGDSITLGDYVEEVETYPSRLQEYLQKSDPHVRVINAGIGSADIHNQHQILLESGLKTQPDVVLVGLYLNDGELSANLAAKPLPLFFKKSYFADYLNRKIRFLAYRWKHRKEMAGTGKDWVVRFVAGRKIQPKDWKREPEGFDYLIVENVRDWGAAWDPVTWDVIGAHLEKIHALAKQKGFKLFVALFPVRYQVEADYLYDAPQKYFQSTTARLKIPSLDLLPVLRTAWSDKSERTLYYDKCHLTPEGNDLVAKSLAQFLLNPTLNSQWADRR